MPNYGYDTKISCTDESASMTFIISIWERCVLFYDSDMPSISPTFKH